MPLTRPIRTKINWNLSAICSHFRTLYLDNEKPPYKAANYVIREGKTEAKYQFYFKIGGICSSAFSFKLNKSDIYKLIFPLNFAENLMFWLAQKIAYALNCDSETVNISKI